MSTAVDFELVPFTPDGNFEFGEGAGDTIEAAFTSVDVTGFDASITEGTLGDTIEAEFTSVAVTGLNASITQGQTIAAGFTSVAVTGFAATYAEAGPDTFEATFTAVAVTGFAASLTPAGVATEPYRVVLTATVRRPLLIAEDA